MAKLNVGVVIGRFQVPVLTAGHQSLFGTVAGKVDQVVVLLGVSMADGYTAENPLTFNQRQAIVRASLPAHWEPVILPLVNMRTDEEWSAQIDALLLGAYPSGIYNITLFGGRDSFVDSYKGSLPIERVALCPSVPTAGTLDRAAIKETNDPAFYAGQIYALQRQFPHAYPTVDIAVLRGTGFANLDEVLLIQRADSGRWCFPGGFVDPTDASLEVAAAREVHEELGLTFSSGRHGLTYQGSFRIDDFRYRGTRDKIITTFFTARFFAGPIVPKYDEVQDYKWVEVVGLNPQDISDIHRPLLAALKATYGAAPNTTTEESHANPQRFGGKSPHCTINHVGPCNTACGDY